MTNERLAELHEAAKYAKAHGGGYVNINADELLEVLPALPVEEKAAEPVAEIPVPAAAIPAAVAEGQKAPDSVDPGPLVAGTQAAAVAEPAQEVPAGAPLVDTVTLTQDEINEQINWDKDHPTQEEQERAKAAVQPAGPVLVPEAGDDPALDAQIEAGTDAG